MAVSPLWSQRGLSITAALKELNEFLVFCSKPASENASEAYISLGSILGKEAARKPSEGQLEAIKDLY